MRGNSLEGSLTDKVLSLSKAAVSTKEDLKMGSTKAMENFTGQTGTSIEVSTRQAEGMALGYFI